jgi:hypothetical protein
MANRKKFRLGAVLRHSALKWNRQAPGSAGLFPTTGFDSGKKSTCFAKGEQIICKGLSACGLKQEIPFGGSLSKTAPNGILVNT